MILPVTLPYDIVPILWNPSIHKSVFLPSPGVRLPSSYEPMEYLGFGYDPITDDYKVVRLVYLHGWDERSFQGEEPSVVQIYSLRTNAWRTIPGPGHRYIIKEQSLSVFVNGSVHWLAHVGNVDTDSEDDYSDDDPPCNVIFTFNIRDEVFRKMDVPKYYEDTFDLNMMVALVGDKLGLVPGNFNLWSSKACYSVWVMKEYGLAESWTKLYNIRIGPDLENVVGFAKNEVIVNKYGTLLSYNPRKRERSDPGIEALSTSFYMDTYMESLVLLNVEDDALRKQAKSSTASKGIRAKVKRKRKVGVSFKQAGKGSARLMQKLMLKPRKSRKREGSATRTNTLQTGESSSKQMKKVKNKTKEVA
nr:F-box/kelch-repeat protein At3g06240-like isoform X1 [Quercus suber]